MELTARQRAELQSLLEDELQSAISQARDRGASPATLDATLNDRAELLNQLLDDPADDAHDPLDQGRKGSDVPEQG
jgi:hypothetical protein